MMLRTYKLHRFNFPGISGSAVHFSSYPAIVHSIDDFYQTSAGLIVIETTNNVANSSLYSLVTSQSVPTFVRVVVSNRLSMTGADWANTYTENNSGQQSNE